MAAPKFPVEAQTTRCPGRKRLISTSAPRPLKHRLEGRVAMLGVMRADGRDEVGDLALDVVEMDVGADRVLDANVLRVRAHGVLDDGERAVRARPGRMPSGARPTSAS